MKSTHLFVDEATISVTAGRGGNGCVSFRREKFVPRGGPNGGDGGRGGDVVLVGDRNLGTLLDPKLRRVFEAGRGAHGQGHDRCGRDGGAVEIRVPLGTLVFDADADASSAPIADLTNHEQRVRIARGGRGGRGNARFATSTRQAPRFAEEGQPGETRRLRLALKLLADVGLMGFPNAGKSTLLRRISAARPRTAPYPFTTLVPMLGVAEVDAQRFVVADIPGLIPGASEGAGLGIRFLRHVERTRVLVHLLDLGAWQLGERDPLDDYARLRRELEAYHAPLVERTELVALNKIDLCADRRQLETLVEAFQQRGRDVYPVSAATGEGTRELLRGVARALSAARDRDAVASASAAS
ncbi:MAG: GTPase ObgE [Deltaproteobacteria bacterium]|nr:MAG: GTPase ObgE [Deltaproteobacteria bacterium]